jgi:hypothetical protein
MHLFGGTENPEKEKGGAAVSAEFPIETVWLHRMYIVDHL